MPIYIYKYNFNIIVWFIYTRCFAEIQPGWSTPLIRIVIYNLLIGCCFAPAGCYERIVRSRVPCRWLQEITRTNNHGLLMIFIVIVLRHNVVKFFPPTWLPHGNRPRGRCKSETKTNRTPAAGGGWRGQFRMRLLISAFSRRARLIGIPRTRSIVARRPRPKSSVVEGAVWN